MKKMALILPMFLLLACGGGEKKEEGKDKGSEQAGDNSKHETMTITSYELVKMMTEDADGFIKKTQEAKLVITDLVLESGYFQNGKLGATGVGYSASEKKIIGNFNNPYKYEKIMVAGDSVAVESSNFGIELQEIKVGTLTQVTEKESMEADGVGSITFRTKVSVSGVMVKMVKDRTIIIYSGEVSEHAEI